MPKVPPPAGSQAPVPGLQLDPLDPGKLPNPQTPTKIITPSGQCLTAPLQPGAAFMAPCKNTLPDSQLLTYDNTTHSYHDAKNKSNCLEAGPVVLFSPCDPTNTNQTSFPPGHPGAMPLGPDNKTCVTVSGSSLGLSPCR